MDDAITLLPRLVVVLLGANRPLKFCVLVTLGWVKGVERFLLSVGLNMKLLCGIEATSILPAEGVNKPAAFVVAMTDGLILHVKFMLLLLVVVLVWPALVTSVLV